eukprot:TRINITY_DN7132_c0_g5_i1.p1 TRINITY_DN7132_c0_g5~~TRINITY_DN7132_c0_g5_i1.p1  ORF type:complete len:1345 (-),score=385.45 TRINITY_DN7132_c0_g5_i1:233-4222(-)
MWGFLRPQSAGGDPLPVRSRQQHPAAAWAQAEQHGRPHSATAGSTGPGRPYAAQGMVTAKRTALAVGPCGVDRSTAPRELSSTAARDVALQVPGAARADKWMREMSGTMRARLASGDTMPMRGRLQSANSGPSDVTRTASACSGNREPTPANWNCTQRSSSAQLTPAARRLAYQGSAAGHASHPSLPSAAASPTSLAASPAGQRVSASSTRPAFFRRRAARCYTDAFEGAEGCATPRKKREKPARTGIGPVAALECDKSYQRTLLKQWQLTAEQSCRMASREVQSAQIADFFNFLEVTRGEPLGAEALSYVQEVFPEVQELSDVTTLEAQLRRPAPEFDMFEVMELNGQQLQLLRKVLRQYALVSVPLPAGCGVGAAARVRLSSEVDGAIEISRPSFCRFLYDSGLVHGSPGMIGGKKKPCYATAVRYFDTVGAGEQVGDKMYTKGNARTATIDQCVAVISQILGKIEMPLQTKWQQFEVALETAQRTVSALHYECQQRCDRAAEAGAEQSTEEAVTRRRMLMMSEFGTPPDTFDGAVGAWTRGLRQWMQLVNEQCMPESAVERAERQFAMECYLRDALVQPDVQQAACRNHEVFKALYEHYRDMERQKYREKKEPEPDADLPPLPGVFPMARSASKELTPAYAAALAAAMAVAPAVQLYRSSRSKSKEKKKEEEEALPKLPHMSFASFLRFAVDFDLFPTLLSFDEVRAAYGLVECREPLEVPAEPPPPSSITESRRSSLTSAAGDLPDVKDHASFSTRRRSSLPSLLDTPQSPATDDGLSSKSGSPTGSQEEEEKEKKKPELKRKTVTAAAKWKRGTQAAVAMTSMSRRVSLGAASTGGASATLQLPGPPGQRRSSRMGEAASQAANVVAAASAMTGGDEYATRKSLANIRRMLTSQGSVSQYSQDRGDDDASQEPLSPPAEPEPPPIRLKAVNDFAWLSKPAGRMTESQRDALALVEALVDCTADHFNSVRGVLSSVGEEGKQGLLDVEALSRALSRLNVTHKYESEEQLKDFIATVDPNVDGLIDSAELEKAVSQVRRERELRREDAAGGNVLALGDEARRLGNDDEKTAYGVAAFTESLMMCALLHMHGSDHSSKSSAPAGIMCQWLIAFLKHRFGKLRHEHYNGLPPSPKRQPPSSILNPPEVMLPEAVEEVEELQAVCDCGNTFKSDSVFCRKCGAKRKTILVKKVPTAPAPNCDQCGFVFVGDAKNCRKCGAPRGVVERELPPPAPTSRPEPEEKKLPMGYCTRLKRLLELKPHLFEEIAEQRAAAQAASGPPGEDAPIEDGVLYPIFQRDKLLEASRQRAASKQAKADGSAAGALDKTAK